MGLAAGFLPEQIIFTPNGVSLNEIEEATSLGIQINIDNLSIVITSYSIHYTKLYEVNPLPVFSIDTPQIVCTSDPTFTIILDPIEDNPSEIFDYQWTYEDGTDLGQTPTLPVSTPGNYYITLTKTDGTGCSRTKEVFVNASELARNNFV